jgi:trehalose synthase
MPPELSRVPLGAEPIDRFRSVLEPDLWERFSHSLRELRASLGQGAIWNINSTAQGGGVAELLAALLPYQRGAGLDARWLVITGSPNFFRVTKRLHNLLHGVMPGGSDVTPAERDEYERTLLADMPALLRQIRPGDVVILHDPQTAGLIPSLIALRCRVIWRCHVGVDQPNEAVRRGWDFLRPYVRNADGLVFSRRAFVWDGLDDARVAIIAPSIDPFTPKNQELDPDTVIAILHAAGLVADGAASGAASFRKQDGSVHRVVRRAEMFDEQRPPVSAGLVVQVSRWDRLKDPLGVMAGFARYVARDSDSHLVLAGPAASAIPDDPEGPATLQQVEAAWQKLEPAVRGRIHLAGLPMADLDENAAVVNAIQRHARVVVQKSLAEGFGLTVAEAMWKARPVVASRVGGIQDQIENGQSGLLIDDPRDLAAFGAAVVSLLRDDEQAGRFGAAAKQRVRRHFLAPRQLMEEAELVLKVVAEPGPNAPRPAGF